jgi:hypothetical protein
MRDGNVTPKVTLCDALEGEGDAEGDTEGEYPGLVAVFVSQSRLEIISSLGFLLRCPEQKKQRVFLFFLTD